MFVRLKKNVSNSLKKSLGLNPERFGLSLCINKPNISEVALQYWAYASCGKEGGHNKH